MSTDYKCVTEIGAVREYLAGHDLVSFDYETAPDAAYRMEEKAALDPAKAHICTMSLSVKEHTGIMIPVAHLIGTNMDTDTFYQFLREFLTDKNITKICHNYVFESSFSYKNGIVIQAPVYDTICAAQMTLKAPGQFRKLSDSGLKTLALNLCKEPLPSFTAVTEGRNFDELDPADPETIRYSCADADFALRLYHICNNWFDKYLPNHRWIVENIESPTAVFVGMMKQNGIPMDIKAMTDAKSNADSEINRLKDEIGGITGGVEVGSNCSTASFKNFLYESKQLPILKRTDKLAPSVDDEALLLLKDFCEEHDPDLTALFDKVLEYRKWQKLKSTYLDGYLNFVNNATGRIHPDLMQLATETGRFACRRPNLQNSPQKGQDPVGIRNFIKAPDGWSLLESDYSQAEIRLCAYLSQDQVLLQAYRDGQDVHAITTSAVFHIPLEEAMDHGNPQYKHRRTVAKGTMFGIMYGIGGAGLSRNLYTNAGVTISREECDSYIQGILDKYTGMAAWQQ
ncbi:MAG: bifunctional 3'-5' exonuclease/DNA polymerase, partial [Lachnospiraceae bacterium]|nr:bifunctional 3'-5' exonuclease/DNA polymerase [Lachnospiraceae bacterium]